MGRDQSCHSRSVLTIELVAEVASLMEQGNSVQEAVIVRRRPSLKAFDCLATHQAMKLGAIYLRVRNMRTTNEYPILKEQ